MADPADDAEDQEAAGAASEAEAVDRRVDLREDPPNGGGGTRGRNPDMEALSFTAMASG